MSWGGGAWGTGSWGTGLAAAPPLALGTSTPFGLGPSGAPIVDILGGTIIRLLGDNFYDPMTVEVLLSGLVVGTCYMFDPALDLTRNVALIGSPPLAAGTYDLRVTTGAGTVTLANAIQAMLFAEEMKVHRVRIAYGHRWKTGDRLLGGG